MSFQDALARNPALERVGDVWLRFEESLLIGETRPLRSGMKAPVWGAVAVALGVTTAALALWPAAPLVLLVWLGLASAGAAFVAQRLGARARTPRRFVLNFATETLRLDEPSGAWGTARTRLLPFDAVLRVETVEAPRGRRALRVLYREPEKNLLEQAWLAREVREVDAAELERLARLLREALGVRAEPTLDAPRDFDPSPPLPRPPR